MSNRLLFAKPQKRSIDYFHETMLSAVYMCRSSVIVCRHSSHRHLEAANQASWKLLS